MWKSIKGYEGIYEVSSAGKVKSLSRRIKNKGGRSHVSKERILKPYLNKRGKGYYSVILIDANGNKKNKTVHRLVAEAFIPNPNNLRDVDHIDDCTTNNKVSNLQWLSSGDNTRKSFKISQRMGRAKLTSKNVKVIRWFLANTKLTNKVIASLYNVSPSRVSEIKTGKIWTHITEVPACPALLCTSWKELQLIHEAGH